MSQEVLQQLLNRSVAHIRQQGKPSMEDDSCLYRSPDGRGCAAAPFIKNYDPEMEHDDWSALAVHWADALDPEAVLHEKFVTDVLQESHDNAARARANTDFLQEYEQRIKCGVHGWNLNNGTTLTIPPVGWEVV
jgi:hypothetical protein